MAFNKSDNQPVIQSGFISSSRGTDTNRAFGELFEGVGRTLTNGLNAYDDATRTNIEMEANAGVNELAEADTPPAVKSGVETINNLKNARDQGAYTEEQFQTRLLQKVKQIKSKTPQGYHSVVDAAWSSALGTSSANRLRSERIAEIKAAEGNVTKEEKTRTDFFDKYNQVLASQQGQKLYKDLTGKDFDFTTAGINEMRYVVARIEGEKYDREQELAQANLDNRKTKSAVTGWMIGEMNKGLSEANPLFKEFNERFKKARDAGSPGGDIITDEERIELLPKWQNYRTQFSAGLKASMYSPDAADAIKKMSSADLKDVFAISEDMLNSYEEILKSPTPAILKLLEDDIGVKLKRAETDLLKNPAVAKYTQMLKSGIPKEVIEDVLSKKKKNSTGDTYKDSLDDQIGTAIIQDLILGETTLNKALEDGAKEGATPQALLNTVEDAMKTIANDKLDPSVAAVMANSMFAPDSQDILEKYAKENPLKMFDTLVRPDIWAKLKGTDAEKRFVDFAEHQFVILGQKTGSALIDAKATMEYGSIRFDGKRFLLDESSLVKQVAESTKDRSLVGMIASMPYIGYEKYKLEAARKHVFTMNKLISTMEPIWADLGIPQEQMAARILAAIGGDINSVESKGNIFSQTIKGLKDFIMNPKDVPNDETQGGTAPPKVAPQNVDPRQKSEAPSMTGRSLVDASRAQDMDDVEVSEEYGPGRPGRPSATIRDLAKAAAADTGMSRIRFTSGKGNTISASGKKRGQKSTMHSTGNALDVAGFASDEEKFQFIENAVANGANGVGVYSNGSVHIDTGKARSWDWSGVQDDELKGAIKRGLSRRKQQTASK